MTTLLDTVSDDYLSVSWRSPRTSEAVNERAQNFRPGCVRGFRPTPGAGDLELDLEVDFNTGDSVMNVADTNGHGVLTYRTEATVTLDLTAVAGTTVFIAFVVDYEVGSATVGYWRTYSTAEATALTHVTDKAVIVCCVAVPGSGAIPESSIVLGYAAASRDELSAVRDQGTALERLLTCDFGERLSSVHISSNITGGVERIAGYGSGAMKWTIGSSGEELAVSTGTYAATIGDKFLVRLRYRTDSFVAVSARLRIAEYDVAGIYLTATSVNLGTTTGWLDAALPIAVTDSDTESVQITLEFEGTSGWFALDFVALFRVLPNASDVPWRDKNVVGVIAPTLVVLQSLDLTADPWLMFVEGDDLIIGRMSGVGQLVVPQGMSIEGDLDVGGDLDVVDGVTASSVTATTRFYGKNIFGAHVVLSISPVSGWTISASPGVNHNVIGVSADGGTGDYEVSLEIDHNVTAGSAVLHSVNSGVASDITDTVIVATLSGAGTMRVQAYSLATGLAKVATDFSGTFTVSVGVVGGT